MDELEVQFSEIAQEVEKIFSSQTRFGFDNELEHVAACYFVLKKCVQSKDQSIEIQVAHNCSTSSKSNEALESFKDIFIEPFYDYIDEHIDDKSLILSILTRYKQKCEWFQRNQLYELWKSDTRSGEKHLAKHLYEYLHDQGLDFFIEPASASGEADLVSSQTGEEPLIADAKIFNHSGGQNKSYLAKGFRQLYSYTLDYNESFGYLLVFKVCEEDLKFSLPHKALQIPFLTHNNKTLFFVTIDICQYTKSASKRGVLKRIEMTESDLIQVLSS